MCPVCLATAFVIAGKVAATGGAAATIAIRKPGGQNAVANNPDPATVEKENSK
jgi:hypothetical protein